MADIARGEPPAAAASRESALSIALACIGRGIPVFPLQWPIFGRDGTTPRCSCGRACASTGKHPLTRAGFKDATTDPSTVRAWFKQWPDANIGIPTGSASGLFVIDVDPGGDATLSQLENKYGPLPRTLRARTGRGGFHLYFRYPAERVLRNTQGGSGRGLGPHVDTRGEGGYVVAPPSRHASGAAYAWVDRLEPAALPATWLRALEQQAQSAPTTAGASRAREEPSPAATRPDPYAIVSNRVSEGGRHQALLSFVGALVGAGVRLGTVRELVLQVNRRNCDPPKRDDEVRKLVDDIWRKDADARAGDAATSGKKASATAPQEGADPLRALKAFAKTQLTISAFEPTCHELEAVWNATGETLRLPLVGKNADVLQPALLPLAGDLLTFACRAHSKAKPRQLLQVLRDMAVHAPKKHGDHDGDPVQLVETLLALEVWSFVKVDDGPSMRRPYTLETQPGCYPEQGAALTRHNGRRLLVVNFHRLASGVIKAWQFRNRSAKELKKIFEAAPGYCGPIFFRDIRRTMGEARYYGLDVEEFRRITMTEQESVASVAMVVGDENAADTPANDDIGPWDETAPSPSPPPPGDGAGDEAFENP